MKKLIEKIQEKDKLNIQIIHECIKDILVEGEYNILTIKKIIDSNKQIIKDNIRETNNRR